jgi:hypothetical protein
MGTTGPRKTVSNPGFGYFLTHSIVPNKVSSTSTWKRPWEDYSQQTIIENALTVLQLPPTLAAKLEGGEEERRYVQTKFKKEHVDHVLSILRDPTIEATHEAFLAALKQRYSDFDANTWYLPTPPNRFQFDPAKNVTSPVTLQKQIRALANLPSSNFSQDLLKEEEGIFETLWPSIEIENVALTSETRIALGVVALLAHLASVSPQVERLLQQAPDRPNYEFHMPNALLATLKSTVKPEAFRANPQAGTVLLKKTLELLVYFSTNHLPAFEEAKGAFPILSRFISPVIMLLAGTPRLTIDFACDHAAAFKDDDHKCGYRMQGNFYDALLVDPDETCTLAEVLREFELQLVDDDIVPKSCNQGHAISEIHEAYYSYEHGPPGLLFFEARSSTVGIPPASVVPSVVLTEYIQGEQVEYSYSRVAIVRMEVGGRGKEEDLILQLDFPNAEEEDPTIISKPEEEAQHPIARVIYARKNNNTQHNNGFNNEDEEDDNLLMSSIEEDFV